MQSLRRSSHFPSVLTLIFPFPTLILPLLLAHFKLSHVGGWQTGAPQCGVSLIRTDRHQRESAACVSVPRSCRLIFIFIFPLPEFFPKTSRRKKKPLPFSVFVNWVQLHLFTFSCCCHHHVLLTRLPPSFLAVSVGQPEWRHGHSVHTECEGEQLLRGLRCSQYVSFCTKPSDFASMKSPFLKGLHHQTQTFFCL